MTTHCLDTHCTSDAMLIVSLLISDVLSALRRENTTGQTLLSTKWI
jgi:hypothetical protein